MSIKELNIKRSNWVQTNRENGFEEGIGRLLTELYPDNAHFIYELLQNAEDAKASNVRFILHNDYLEFIHNGKRTFEEKDIESISSIGNSTKADDINQIGKFGVGFKAVFAYTDTPKVYSGNYAFQIRDLVVPEEIEDIQRDVANTIFRFPFNNQKKSLSQSVHEIQLTLEKIHDNTLLFLQNIKEIHYTYQDVDNVIKRIEHNDVEIEIYNSLKDTSSRWLRFKKYLPESTSLYASIAYSIQYNDKTSTDEILQTSGEVSIFFPAEKETSNLRFHLHAPFASTVARDSLKDLDENRKLINLIAETAVDSLKYIKENNLLTIHFLSILPILDDNLPPFYQPIFRAIINAFIENEYVPTDSGEYRSARACFKGSPKIKEILDDGKLEFFIGKQNSRWARNASMKNGREDRFIQNIKVAEFSDKDFFDKLADLSQKFSNPIQRLLYSEEYEKINNFFIKQSDEWMLKFYVFLQSLEFERWFNKSSLSFYIRLEDGSLNTSIEKCFFLGKYKDLDFSYVKRETYISSEKMENNKKARAFLESLGVKEIEEEDQITYIIKLYSNFNKISFDEHCMHLKTFLEYCHRTSNYSFFKYKKIIFCVDHKGDARCEDCGQIYIDEPFQKTGLNVLKRIKQGFYLDHRYLTHFTQHKDEFISFLKHIGAKEKIEIQHANVHVNPDFSSKLKSIAKRTERAREEDWNIAGIDVLLIEEDIEVSKLIWDTMNAADAKVLKAVYAPNQKSDIKTCDSQLIQSLRKHPWLPNKDGVFFYPKDINQESLAFDIIMLNSPWLKSIGLGDNARKNEKDYIEITELLEEKTGFKLSTFEKAKSVGLTEGDLIAIIEKKESEHLRIEEKRIAKSLRESLDKDNGNGDAKPFIESHSFGTNITDEKKYTDSIEKRRESNTGSFVNKSLMHKRQDKKSKEQIRSFLYQEYEGHCQICGSTTAVNGKNYFMMHSLNSGEDREVNVEGNSLSLCPNHFAIFRWKLRELLFWDKLKHLDKIEIEDFNKAFGPRYQFVGKININEKNDAFYNLHEDDNFERDDIRLLPINIFENTEYIKITKAHEIEIINELNRK